MLVGVVHGNRVTSVYMGNGFPIDLVCLHHDMIHVNQGHSVSVSPPFVIFLNLLSAIPRARIIECCP
jgi:hypothetical protein